jgi:putative membrane protein
MPDERSAAPSPGNVLHSDASTELSARRTGMSFQRTRLSAERTLMSVLRTSLSLISFGFTIYQFFGKLQEADLIQRAHAARNFGTTLVVLGTLMLLTGIIYHVLFMRDLRGTRDLMVKAGNIHGESTFPVSYTLVVAFLVLLLGVFAVASTLFRIGPLG